MFNIRRRRSSSWLYFFVPTLLLFTTVVDRSLAQNGLDNKGSDFFIGFIPQLEDSPGEIFTELHLTGDAAATVVIEYPFGTAFTSAVVTPGSVTIVGVPRSSSDGWIPNAVGSNLVRAFSPDNIDFVVYAVNRQTASSDAALALPVDTMNTEYIAVDYNPSIFLSHLLVYAAFDGTTIQIDRPLDDPIEVLLNRGEAYLSSSSESQTGTIVTSNRPIGVTNGNGCTLVPENESACDHVFEVAQPVQTWGTEIGVAELPLRPSGSIYRVVASQDGTTVTMDGNTMPVANLSRGEFYETPMLPGNHVFRANNPIYVAQYMTGQTSSGATSGDPAQGNMIPFAQYGNQYTFSTLPEIQFAVNYVSIIARNEDIQSQTMLLDGDPIAQSVFSPIPSTDFSASVIQISEGTHTTASESPHGITVEGYNDFDSYIYPGGALFQLINPVGDANPPTISIVDEGSMLVGLAEDNRPSEDVNSNGILDPGEDVNGNGVIDQDTGIFFVRLREDSTNLAIAVDSFIPGDASVTFQIELLDPVLEVGSGNVLAIDGAGNVAAQFVEISQITEIPTSSPTNAPTNAPTEFPTRPHSDAPSGTPTKSVIDRFFKGKGRAKGKYRPKGKGRFIKGTRGWKKGSAAKQKGMNMKTKKRKGWTKGREGGLHMKGRRNGWGKGKRGGGMQKNAMKGKGNGGANGELLRLKVNSSPSSDGGKKWWEEDGFLHQ